MKQVATYEFENHFPMIKIFEVNSTCYAYDGKSGMLAEITPEEINQIYTYCLPTQGGIIANYLKDLLDDGVFLPGPLKQVTPKQEDIDGIIRTQLEEVIPKALILEITENCNLNCSYCFFAKEDGFNKRKHSRNNINEATAYKAIDYYYSRYTNAIRKVLPENRLTAITQNTPMLQWWGGEPFTAFDIMVKTKSYFESLDWESYGIAKKEIIYGLTSNLTIFNEEILNFLAQNNVKLRVSLDGNQEAHNKNRVFPNGEGSFSIVLKNLDTIINKYPDYARKSVGIQSVLADNISIYTANEFIEQHFKLNTPLRKLIMRSTSPQRKKNVFLSEFEITTTSLEECILLLKNKLDKIAANSLEENEKILTNNQSLYMELKKIIKTEDLLVLDSPKGSDTISKMFSCALGADRIFVSARGDFHCCAKTDYSSSFGNVETGINSEKLKDIYISYHKEVGKQCQSCWAFRFCNICPALAGCENLFLLPTERECEQIRKNILLRLAQYIILTDRYEHLYSQIKSLDKFIKLI